MIASFLIAAISLQTASAQVSKYQPCPLLGPPFPEPVINTSSSVVKAAFDGFSKYIDTYLEKGDGDFGPITPNTTTFSIALFVGDNLVGNSTKAFFYEYHHGASNKTVPTSDSVYAIGDLTQLFTVFTLLAELGSDVWEKRIVDFVPELARGASNGSSIQQVRWRDITLGSLAGHLSGIGRDSNACRIDRPCDKSQFIDAIVQKPPVYLSDTTPIYSHAAFQLLAYALESNSGQPYSSLLQSRILDRLSLNSTSLLTPNSTLSLAGEPASLGLLSTTHDLSLFGRSILQSTILSPLTTRRWLKPVTSTSNLRNSVGRPWEIYHYSNRSTDPITDIYTKSGNIGNYASYFGLAPDYGVGFTILAEDPTGAPDLNAYADMVLGALLEIQALGRAEAKMGLSGSFGNGSLVLNVTGSADPGLKVEKLLVNETDWLAKIAEDSNIELQYLDLRFYPTNLEEKTANGGKRRAFRGVVQDMNALVDAGTPTCVSWMTIDRNQINGFALDEIVFELDMQGRVITIEWPALEMRFEKDRA